MFSQIFMAVIGLLLFYIGVVERSMFNIIIATLVLIMTAGKFYAAKSGSSFEEAFYKWRTKRNQKNGE